MNLRFYKIWLALSIVPGAADAASNAAWNCEQNTKGEWTCLNQGPANSAEPAKTQPAEAVPQARPKVVQVPAQPAAPQVATQPVPVQPAVQPEQKIAQPEPKALQPEPVKAVEQAAPKVEPEATKLAEKPVIEPPKMRVKITENQKPTLEKVEAVREKASVADAGKPAGWTCQSGGDKQNWNCNLVGPDPKGEPQVVAETQVSSPWLTPYFSSSQERAFQTLRAEFDQDPWQNCQTWTTRKRKIKGISQEARENATTDVTADFSEVFEGEVMSFAGNVDLNRADQHLMADNVSYDTGAQSLDAQGNVLYSEQQLAFSSDTASLSLNKDEARLRKAMFIAGEAPLRGSAETVYRDSKSLSRYNEAAFTSCPPGNQDWIGHASRLKINRDTGQGSAKNAWLEFKGVPVLYTPYISFPTDNRRLSGLLAPTWGRSQRNGFDVSAPFYWNIAPNLDTTIIPRYMDRRGEMISNKLRYMTDVGQGSFAAQYLPNDQILNKARYMGSFKDLSIYTPHLNSNINLNYVSDNTYFNDLNNALGIQTARFLPSTASVNYARPDVTFSTGMQHYQLIEKKIELKTYGSTDSNYAGNPLSQNYQFYRALTATQKQDLYNAERMPYDVLPKVALNLKHHFEGLPVTVGLDNQYNYFSHSDLVNGQRINIAPSLSLPLESSAGFFIPKITGQYTQYQLSNQTQEAINAGQSSSISRALPIFSVDSGMAFEKPMDFGGTPYTNTLEPRAFYLYIPRKDQSNIPLFDTSTYDTNIYSLFRENRFSGGDRIQDANQITLAATSRFINNTTGLEPLKVSLGQTVYFQDRAVDTFYKYDPLFDTNNVNYQNLVHPLQTTQTSNFIGEIGGQMTRNLSYMTGAQWDPEHNRLARGQAVLKFRHQPNEILNLGYRYRRNTANNLSALSQTTISQTDVSFRWPLFAEWYGLGRWQYSLNFDKTTESFIGIEKENCCWRFRILGRRYINGANTGLSLADNNLKPETAFFVQLELKGLTSFGDSVDSFLQTNLNGYRKDSYVEDN